MPIDYGPGLDPGRSQRQGSQNVASYEATLKAFDLRLTESDYETGTQDREAYDEFGDGNLKTVSVRVIRRRQLEASKRTTTSVTEPAREADRSSATHPRGQRVKKLRHFSGHREQGQIV